MSMVALVLAAGLTPAAVGDRFAVPDRRSAFASPRAAACPPLGLRLVPTKGVPRLSIPQRAGPVVMRRLGDLPKANLTLTVLRSVDGCAVSSTVRYDVEGDGRAPPAGVE